MHKIMIMNSTNYQTELKSYLARVQHFTLVLAVKLVLLFSTIPHLHS